MTGKYTFKEVRFIIEKDYTDVYVHITADCECPHTVEGWHYKRFSNDIPAVDILYRHIKDAVLWPNQRPDKEQENETV